MKPRLSLLIAEDESLVAEMVRGVVEDLGHTVAGVAATGAEAVRMTAELKPSAVLMDIKMPDMDGIEAARRIAGSCPTPVVILSAFESPEMVEQATSAGVGAYLTKPAGAPEVARALAVAMARHADLMELRRVNADLRRALAAVRRLSGLLPICSNCKRIRDDRGNWQQLEEYIQSHSEAEFTHGVCPDCSRELYPGHSPQP